LVEIYTCSICKGEIDTIPIYDNEVGNFICIYCLLRKKGIIHDDSNPLPITVDFLPEVEIFTHDSDFSLREGYLNKLKPHERAELNSLILNPEICRKMCEEYQYSYNLRSAIDICIHATKLNPFNINILLDLALLYMQVKSFDKTIQTYEKVLRMDSENADAIEGIGECWYEKQNYLKAKEFLEQATELAPTYWRAWHYLAQIYDHFGEAENYERASTICDYHTPPIPLLYRGRIIERHIDKDSRPFIIIEDHPKGIKHYVSDYNKKDKNSIYASLRIGDLVNIFENGYIYVLDRISRDSWTIRDFLPNNTVVNE